jgi:hypothetical protein
MATSSSPYRKYAPDERAVFDAAMQYVRTVHGFTENQILVKPSRKDGSRQALTMVCIIMQEANCSLPQIAAMTGRYHTSVMRAMRGHTRESLSEEIKALHAHVCTEEIKAVADDMVARALRGGVPLVELGAPRPRPAHLSVVAKPKDKPVEPVKAPVLDRDRAAFEKIVETLKATPRPLRRPVWESACRRLFPYTFKAQAIMPPTGVQLD